MPVYILWPVCGFTAGLCRQSEEEPEDGTSSRSGGRLNLASAAAPEQHGPAGRQAPATGSVLLSAVHERYEVS